MVENVNMTCKIDRHVVGKDRVVLRVSGRLTGEAVNMLRASLEQEDGRLTIDLKDLRFVDGDAVKLLTMYESNGAQINNCPLYIRELMRRERGGSGSV